MRKIVILSGFAVVASLCFLNAPSTAAPALADKASRWEYAELSYRRISAKGEFGPANPPAAAQPAQARTAYKWITSEGEVEGTSWDDLGAKLKALPAKKEATAAMQKLNLFNHLGSEGWELVGQDGIGTSSGFSRGTSTSTWLFKRRLP